MTGIDTTDLPSELVENAIRSYRFDAGSTVEEKLLINYWCQKQEVGDFNLSVEDEKDTVNASIEINGDSYSRSIKKMYEDFHVDIYPIGDVKFDRADLAAVSAVGGFPWTTEVFSCWYLGYPNEESLQGEDEKFANIRILQQYYPPRKITSEPPSCTIPSNSEESSYEFMEMDIRNATHCKTPNPWIYGSFAVLYENTDVASKIISSDQVHGDVDDYSLTPPESLNQFFVDFN